MTKQPPLFALPRAPAPADFDAFWQVYPRKVDRHDAERAWLRAVRLALPEVLTAACERFAAAMEGKEREFIPHAATWLNKRRWLDWPEPATLAGASIPVAPTPAAPQAPPSALRAALDAIATGGLWDRPTLGPAPGERGCRVPAHAIRQADVDQLQRNEAEARTTARQQLQTMKGNDR